MNTPHLLEMVTAMTNQTIMIVPLMVETAVDLVLTQNIVRNVNV